MRLNYWFLALCLAAASVPLFEPPAVAISAAPAEWPVTYEGVPLQPVPMADRERAFYATFPGAVGRFTDGRREFILRRITRGTRKLHLSADCFRGLGYTVSPGSPEADEHGRSWGCFTASRGELTLRVRERISSESDGKSWTDVSAWYWSTLLRSTRGPWLAVTVAERES